MTHRQLLHTCLNNILTHLIQHQLNRLKGPRISIHRPIERKYFIDGRSGNSENNNEFKSNFEMTFSTIIKLNNETKNKEELEKILLVEVQKENYPYMEKVFLNTIQDAGFDNFKIEKKIDFEELYKNKSN